VARDTAREQQDGVADGEGLAISLPATTNAELKDRDVAVKGCIWTCNGEKSVAWAEVK
jgi:hypothetical protein